MIWGALKNRIAMGPASSVADLGSYIAAGLEAITSKEWLGAYKKMRKQEKAYMNLVLPPQTTPAPSVQELQDLSTADATDTQNAVSIETLEGYHIYL
ncbi:hypothetical protein GN244_ATG05278 [Phytophthora infestans]|uniref:Uncharacterized protein n=1 Tax=Phytophthora infestans TaxID=4787 RepID=A0A833TKL6_PHYIN|nr:hypothetical protein GN244_ATG05278 [Phytophthora infestans]